MEAIYLLIFMGAVVAVGFLVAFFISVKNGQFDDNETPAMRILFDDDKPKVRNEISEVDIKEIEK
ncbi:MAG: cbb3-type cytochrome oxidase assembly protein CcoS [Saprospiraceae bacterium]|nr:cbb3-type cytochrome oxidase assembly protein CcoS [Saprospiraceae bacterium]